MLSSWHALRRRYKKQVTKKYLRKSGRKYIKKYDYDGNRFYYKLNDNVPELDVVKENMYDRHSESIKNIQPTYSVLFFIKEETQDNLYVVYKDRQKQKYKFTIPKSEIIELKRYGNPVDKLYPGIRVEITMSGEFWANTCKKYYNGKLLR